MRHSRDLVPDAHVRAAVVVEVDVPADDMVCMFHVPETPLAVDTLHLYDAVGPLGYGVVRGVVVLGHADGDVMGLQHGHIVVAAILHATVGVVDQPLEAVASTHGHGLGDGLFQGLHGYGRAKAVGKHPAHYLVGVRVGYQVQVADAPVGQVYVGDVGHPYTVGFHRDKPFHQVLPLVVAVVGVGRMADLAGREHQAVTPQQHVEAVAPGHETGAEQGAEHYPKLVTADAGVFMTDFLHVGDDDTLASRFFHDVGFQLVESLAAMAKQTAGLRDLQAANPDQLRYCLAPGFFRMGMLKYSSARVIIKSRASVSRREKDRAFSNSLMRFFSWAFSSR